MEEVKHNQEPDLFSEKIRQKLENHAMPVDADVWKGIEKRMAAPKRIVPAWLYVSVAVAAGLALLFSVGNFIYLRENLIPVSEEIAQHKQETQQFIVTPEQPVQKRPVDEQPEVVAQKQSTARVQQSVVNSAPVSEPVQISVADTQQPVSTEEVQENRTVASEAPQEAIVEAVTEVVPEQEVRTETEQRKPVRTLTLPEEKHADWTTSAMKKKKKSVSLALELGSGVASSSVSVPGRSRAYRSESLVSLPTGTAQVLTPNHFRNKDYLPPFTAGLSAQMPLSEDVAVKSGMMYTNLMTRLSGSNAGDYRAEVNLHYLGIPADLVWSFFKQSKWEMYLSGGGMLEKGIRTEFKQYQNWDDVEVNTSANTDVDGVQWSLNGTLGIGYMLQKNIALFFDPKVSYYFENDQPYSIRKELPVLVSLNTGLRMSF
jgi:hypothetical protein